VEESVSDNTTSNQLVASQIQMTLSDGLKEISLENDAMVDRSTLRQQLINNKRSALFTLVKDMVVPLTEIKSKLRQLSRSKTV
jgi:hypothetical protein